MNPGQTENIHDGGNVDPSAPVSHRTTSPRPWDAMPSNEKQLSPTDDAYCAALRLPEGIRHPLPSSNAPGDRAAACATGDTGLVKGLRQCRRHHQLSERLVEQSSLPVAVVRAGAPVRGGRVVVGVDGSRASRDALTWAAAEARARDADLDVVHAWRVPALAASPLDIHERRRSRGRGPRDPRQRAR